MRKIFISLLLAFITLGVNAQNTYNMRVGFGAGNDHHGCDKGLYIFQFQSNIPFQRGGKLTFSPSIVLATELDDAILLYAPLTVGCKVSLGGSKMFIPKFGVAVGAEVDEGQPIVGPTIGLDFELSHFVIGINGLYSLAEADYEKSSYGKDFNHHGINLTLGYKF